MPFNPSRLEARAALDGDRHLVARQRATTQDPFESFLSSIFGGGDETTTSNTRTTRGVTATTPTLLPTTPITTRTTTSTTQTTPTRPATTAIVVTAPPSVVTAPRVSTVFSTASVDTGNTDASQANNNGSSSNGLPSVVIGIIVAASVIFGLIFIALIARKIFQSRRRNRRNTWARTSVVSPFGAPAITTEKALPPPPPMENQAPANYPAYPPTAVAAVTFAPQPYSPAAASSAGYPAPYPFGASGNAPLIMQQNNNNNNNNNSGFTAADLAGPVVIQHTPPTPTSAGVAISVVKRTFVPSLPDELSISNGDRVRVLSAYDDGWALCEKVTNGEKGVVPQECLEMVKQTSPSGTGSEESRLNRNSSLRRGQDQTY